ncbi:GNAT family N-acetyltransferase [Streptoalloteichus tenebrarius]|uniref:GNAT family N-acetyltransferase n=1 Tax=Streptoalloteichus tenebrarius (strain ATCC 17920 / DSM 40477 / JCM 4838 / CBS 697.72 / NBRC 16177 / NCIMB 11028 / NRRL B-12390 / A12253. 1 / ISP 5477) TaxID=1933 RepID=UPI0020A42BB9|nr:GNAT family N-acetyltransferase [Streptoalloteichus tenebrarius]
MTVEHLATTLHVARPDQLSVSTLYALLRLRAEVFVVEQGCAYADPDGRDLEPGVLHLWISPTGAPEHVLAALRVLPEPDGGWRIGRVVTAKEARGRGLARDLMTGALAEIGSAPCVLGAQTYVRDFYASFGFEVVGEEYLEDGIPHVEMRRVVR